MNWRETLTDILAGYVNQQTLEEGADQMAFVGSDHEEYHHRFVEAIEQGLQAIMAEDSSVLGIINKSGFHVTTMREASDLLLELLGLYLQRVRKASTDSQSNVPELSHTEIQRRMKEKNYSTAEVLDHLRKLQNP